MPFRSATRCRSLPPGATSLPPRNTTLTPWKASPLWVQLNYEKGADKPYRGWYSNYPVCDANPNTSEYHCDEYPFFSSGQGGPMAVPRPLLKVIDRDDNVTQGSNYGGFISTCELRTGNPPADRSVANSRGGSPFLAIPIPPDFGIPTQKLCNRRVFSEG